MQIVKAAVESIMYYHTDGDSSTNGVYKIALGITVTSQNSKYVYDTETGYGKIKEDVLVQEVNSLGTASKLGIKQGDIIRAIVVDGTSYEFNRYFNIGDLLMTFTEGESFYIVYERSGIEHSTISYTVSKSDIIKVD